jgi:hypothetical protein
MKVPQRVKVNHGQVPHAICVAAGTIKKLLTSGNME